MAQELNNAIDNLNKKGSLFIITTQTKLVYKDNIQFK